MKRFIKSLVLVTLLVGMTMPVWSQTPSTEGRDFWVTFLQASENDGGPEELKLTISAREACQVTIENTNTGYSTTLNVGDNSSTEELMSESDCYSKSSEQATYTALHVTSTKDISLFAGNYRDKSFDAANILPTTALLDDYLIQTYPPSDHEDNGNNNKSQGSHFAIVAVEDNTIVDYVLTAQTKDGHTGARTTATLNKGQVWYVWTGKKSGDAGDLSGTTVKARNGKKIAVFQGCPHTNLPYTVRDRDHLFSQAMPTAYWGAEFGITASCKHRRDIVAVMAINDGTEVYINDADGDKVLVHTFDFNSTDPQERKHYWTFEIGEELAYCADNAGQSPSHGKLPEPLVIDSSCYLTTSCPAGVHLFMVSNRYDNLTPTVDDDTLVSDPAMLWISPIEQVIKEINFATYTTNNGQFNYMNIVTTTANTQHMEWTDQNGAKHNIQSYFHPIMGNSDYSFARIKIDEGTHNLKGYAGFLAHVYGYGQRESYAYSCGSSTVQRSITFDGMPLMQDSIYPGKFCVNEEIGMKLNIGNNDYQNVLWDFGDGITYSPDVEASNDEKKQTSHVYTTPGWYDLVVSAEYVNACTGTEHNEDMRFSFRVVSPDTVYDRKHKCISLDGTKIDGEEVHLTEDSIAKLLAYGDNDTLPRENCYDTVYIYKVEYGRETEYEYPYTAKDSIFLGGQWRYNDEKVSWSINNTQGCDSLITCNLIVLTCLDMKIPNTGTAFACQEDRLELPFDFKKGHIGETHFICGNIDSIIEPMKEGKQYFFELPTEELKPNNYKARITVQDTICERTLEFPLDFSIYYPTDVFKYKFNNILAVYNKENNGGYDFTAYQWMLNGVPIEGATSSVYHIDTTFVIGQRYSVLLTRSDGVVLPSCWLEIEKVPEYTTVTSNAPATKHLINQRIVIRKDDKDYNIYGQRMK